MAFENLLIRTNRDIGGIVLDAVISETTTSNVRVTRNPVELGADINDHAIIEPKEYSLEAVVTDSPLVGLGAISQLGSLVTSSGFFGSSSEDSRTRSQAAFDSLIAIQESREPISIQTGLKQYNNMLISNITVTQDKDRSRAIFFTAKLTEVILTSTEEIEFPKDTLLADTTQQQGSSPINEGQKALTDVTGNKSVAAGLADTFGSFF